jgi:hypothetical protein
LDAAAREFIAAATEDCPARERLLNELYAAPAGEPIQLPNGKTLEIIDMGGQI